MLSKVKHGQIMGVPATYLTRELAIKGEVSTSGTIFQFGVICITFRAAETVEI